MTARDLFGEDRPVEPAEVRPDVRDLPTLADELKAELRVTARIQRDPFAGHFPFVLTTTHNHGVIRHHGLSRDLRKAPARETLAGACRRLASSAAATLEWVRERRAALGLSNLEIA